MFKSCLAHIRSNRGRLFRPSSTATVNLGVFVGLCCKRPSVHGCTHVLFAEQHRRCIRNGARYSGFDSTERLINHRFTHVLHSSYMSILVSSFMLELPSPSQGHRLNQIRAFQSEDYGVPTDLTWEKWFVCNFTNYRVMQKKRISHLEFLCLLRIENSQNTSLRKSRRSMEYSDLMSLGGGEGWA